MLIRIRIGRRDLLEVISTPRAGEREGGTLRLAGDRTAISSTMMPRAASNLTSVVFRPTSSALMVG